MLEYTLPTPTSNLQAPVSCALRVSVGSSPFSGHSRWTVWGMHFGCRGRLEITLFSSALLFHTLLQLGIAGILSFSQSFVEFRVYRVWGLP